MNAFFIWLCSITPKAWWLIAVTLVYSIVAIVLWVTNTVEWLTVVQYAWLTIASIPLWCRPVANWLGMRPKLADWILRKLK